jgi:hypothetical protein
MNCLQEGFWFGLGQAAVGMLGCAIFCVFAFVIWFFWLRE